MGSLIEELKRREAAAQAEAGRLRARIEELTAELARAEERVSRLAITREEVMRVLEEPPAADAAWQEAAPAGKPGPPSPRLTAGEKPNRSRMASLVAVYDAEPAERRPHDVIAPPGGRHGDGPLCPGPKARGKWLAGSVRENQDAMIAAMFDEAEARDPGHLRTWVVLVDGAEHPLGLIRAEARGR